MTNRLRQVVTLAVLIIASLVGWRQFHTSRSHQAKQTQVVLVPAAEASPSCGEGLQRCGDLDENGTCCDASSDRCCYVPPSKGDCYCVLKTDKCDRYSDSQVSLEPDADSDDVTAMSGTTSCSCPEVTYCGTTASSCSATCSQPEKADCHCAKKAGCSYSGPYGSFENSCSCVK
jgi:hypothetical protein